MTNLIDNGLKFGTTVTVTLNRDAAGDVTLHVLDEGPGIPEAALQAVLQPFYRLEDSRNRDTGGTGLGLAIAAQLVSQMDGALRPPTARRAARRQRSPCRGGIVS